MLWIFPRKAGRVQLDLLLQASLAAAPALLPDCLPAYQIQAVPAVQNSTQFYNIFLTLPECFYGAVRPLTSVD